jgi:hypothetical protein
MWAQWLSTFPDVSVLPLDIGGGGPEDRRLPDVPWLAERLLSPDERVLLEALAALANNEDSRAGQVLGAAVASGTTYPDIRFLSAACDLRAGHCADALEVLRDLYLQLDTDSRLPEVGSAVRHAYPPLRCLVRITPAQLIPVYPSPYAAALLFAVALDACGQAERALTVLREMVPQYGLLDELRLMAARIHLDQGNVDQAFTALTHAECSEPDALEFTRLFYVAYCHYLREEYRQGAQVLGSAVRGLGRVNPHSQARAHLLLAELYEHCGLLLDALRESAGVAPELLPAGVATLVLTREERWLHALGQLNVPELERMADANVYQAYLPEPSADRLGISRLDTSRDPLGHLKSRSLSWAARRQEEQELAEARAAHDRGEALPRKFGPPLSAAGASVLNSIETAEEWWKTRKPLLSSSAGRPEVSRYVMAESGQLRFDFHGNREPSLVPLEGERRAAGLLSTGSASLAIAALLILIRSCTPW